MKFECSACERLVEHDPAKNGQAMPSGWAMHEIKERRFLLCSGCGGPASFHGGISPHLKNMLHVRHGVTFGDDD